MAGKLNLVTTTTVSSDTSQVILTGIDSTNVYMLVVQGMYMDGTNDDIRIRFTASGSAVTSSNYRYRHYTLYNDTGSGGTIVDNTGNIDLSQGLGTSMNNAFNMVAYLHNFNDSSQYKLQSMKMSTGIHHREEWEVFMVVEYYKVQELTMAYKY